METDNMLIASYNRAGMGDVLVVLTAQNTESVTEQKGSVVRISDNENNLLGYNFLNASEILELYSFMID